MVIKNAASMLKVSITKPLTKNITKGLTKRVTVSSYITAIVGVLRASLIYVALSAGALATTSEVNVHLKGIVMPAQKIKLSFAQSGIVTALADNGSIIEAGQLLGKLDDSKARAMVKQRGAELRSARAELASSLHERDKSARLVSQNILSEVALLEANFSVDMAQERVTVAQVALEIAQISVDECLIVAPFKGAVVDKSVSSGEWMNMGDPFMEYVNLSSLSLSIDIPPDLISGLHVGLSTQILLQDTVVGQASVKTIFPVIDPASGLRRVIWQVIPEDNVLLTGRYVSLATWSPAGGVISEKAQQ